MAAISYSLLVGQTLEQVTTGTLAPNAGSVEIRMDQTANAITDFNAPGNARIVKKGEIQALIRILEEFLLRDTSIVE